MKPKLLSAIMLFVGVVFFSTTSIHGQDQTLGGARHLDQRPFSG